MRSGLDRAERPAALIGQGASLVTGSAATLVYADLPRWEAQQRHRHGEAGSLGSRDAGGDAAALNKRGFFVDWRVCARLKRKTRNRRRAAPDPAALRAGHTAAGGGGGGTPDQQVYAVLRQDEDWAWLMGQDQRRAFVSLKSMPLTTTARSGESGVEAVSL